jgi:indoleamine 2,3-dioxygenase
MPYTGLNGFIPEEDPVQQLGIEYLDWENAISELPDWLSAGVARKRISKIKVININNINDSKGYYERAFLILSVLGQASIHESWRDGSANYIPESIAKPWSELSQYLNRPPVLTYSSHGLNNWRRIDKKGEIELGNIAPLCRFYGGLDESWFISTHVDIEAKSRLLTKYIAQALTSREQGNIDSLIINLTEFHQLIKSMMNVLISVRKYCDPDIFYQRVQPFMKGLDKVVFEGTTLLPQTHPGGSGAQSAIMPAIDAFLGIKHEQDYLSKYLKSLRSYMPRLHKEYVADLERMDSLREWIKQQGNLLLSEAYNKCVACVAEFRGEHMKISIDYIHKPAEKFNSNGKLGTGGSPYMEYLKKHKKETIMHCL